MDAIRRAMRRFYLRPSYLASHAGDVFRLASSKWSVAWPLTTRMLFGGGAASASRQSRP